MVTIFTYKLTNEFGKKFAEFEVFKPIISIIFHDCIFYKKIKLKML